MKGAIALTFLVSSTRSVLVLCDRTETTLKFLPTFAHVYLTHRSYVALLKAKQNKNVSNETASD